MYGTYKMETIESQTKLKSSRKPIFMRLKFYESNDQLATMNWNLQYTLFSSSQTVHISKRRLQLPIGGVPFELAIDRLLSDIGR